MTIMLKRNEYPYLPLGRVFKFVQADDPFISAARQLAYKFRGQLQQTSAAVIVRSENIIGIGSIGQNYHAEKGCERIKLQLPTGTGYDKCPGCHADNHSEANAIRNALSFSNDIADCDLYLWGHWWCCQPCWEKMLTNGIRNVYLLEHAEVLFNKSHRDNIVGKQFADM